jgi:serine phosphatase RsbU (regulator of sigma subunit)/PAS domain-containing protein
VIVLAAALGVGAALYVGVAVYVWRHRWSVGGRALTLLLLSAGLWTVLGAVEVSGYAGSQVLFGDLKYVGIVGLPPALLSFALEYTGRRRRMGRRWVAALSVEPVLVLAALALPSTRSLVRSVHPGSARGGLAVVDAGPLFWVHAGYSYLLIVSAIAIMVTSLLRISRQHLVQAWVLILACVLPLAVNAGYNTSVLSVAGADPTPLAFALAALVLVWGFFRFRLLGLVPVGRNQVVEGLPDAVFVLDVLGHVVDVNAAAALLTGTPQGSLVGRRLLDVLPGLAELAGEGGPVGASSGSAVVPAPPGSDRAIPDDVVELAVTFSPLPVGSLQPSGRLVVLRDVTEQVRAQRRLGDLLDERTGTIEVLQRGLYPARLPLIPGLRVAAVLDPAEAETSIGGDFVDCRAVGATRWTLMVGDVVGKGAGAATLTALARHTTNALCALGWGPSAVLREVNRALASEEQSTGPSEDVRFATMVLANVERVADGAHVVLALAGHPRPMLVTASGRVREVGVPGSLLGVLAQPELHDVGVYLRAGESLVLFTDGVLESRRDDDAYGETRLTELLSRLAGEPPEVVVEAVVRAVRDFGEGYSARDDVAVLVLSVPPDDPPVTER